MEEAGIEKAGAGNSLEQVKQQLQQWRAGRKRGEHIPAPLWAAAAGAAKEHGLYRVAIELHLDYAGLERRFEGAGVRPPRGELGPRFVELFAPAASMTSAAGRAQCVVELHNAHGATMRVDLAGSAVTALADLCKAFCGA